MQIRYFSSGHGLSHFVGFRHGAGPFDLPFLIDSGAVNHTHFLRSLHAVSITSVISDTEGKMQRFQGFRDEYFIPQQIQFRDTAATLCRPEKPAA